MTCQFLKYNLITYYHVEKTKCRFQFIIHTIETIEEKTIGSLFINNSDILCIFKGW